MLGSDGNLEFMQDASGMKVRLPADRTVQIRFVLKITGLK